MTPNGSASCATGAAAGATGSPEEKFHSPQQRFDQNHAHVTNHGIPQQLSADGNGSQQKQLYNTPPRAADYGAGGFGTPAGGFNDGSPAAAVTQQNNIGGGQMKDMQNNLSMMSTVQQAVAKNVEAADFLSGPLIASSAGGDAQQLAGVANNLAKKVVELQRNPARSYSNDSRTGSNSCSGSGNQFDSHSRESDGKPVDLNKYAANGSLDRSDSEVYAAEAADACMPLSPSGLVRNLYQCVSPRPTGTTQSYRNTKYGYSRPTAGMSPKYAKGYSYAGTASTSGSATTKSGLSQNSPCCSLGHGCGSQEAMMGGIQGGYNVMYAGAAGPPTLGGPGGFNVAGGFPGSPTMLGQHGQQMLAGQLGQNAMQQMQQPRGQQMPGANMFGFTHAATPDSQTVLGSPMQPAASQPEATCNAAPSGAVAGVGENAPAALSVAAPGTTAAAADSNGDQKLHLLLKDQLLKQGYVAPNVDGAATQQPASLQQQLLAMQAAAGKTEEGTVGKQPCLSAPGAVPVGSANASGTHDHSSSPKAAASPPTETAPTPPAESNTEAATTVVKAAEGGATTTGATAESSAGEKSSAGPSSQQPPSSKELANIVNAVQSKISPRNSALSAGTGGCESPRFVQNGSSSKAAKAAGGSASD
jgi:hypothetical protein